jgi:hypothetical protein
LQRFHGFGRPKIACKEEGASAKDYLPWWFELFRWPEGITTWAIIATGFVIAWQAYETRRATEATESSAAAALLNTQIQIRHPVSVLNWIRARFSLNFGEGSLFLI